MDEKSIPQGLEAAEKKVLCPSSQLTLIVKRLADIILSAFGLFFLLLPFVWISWRIRRDSTGPVFFKSERMGRNGIPFQILKFRTMYENAQSYQGPPVTASDDNRITPFGEFLRRTKLNELPQLWNVLRGEMSLVGPRPEMVSIALTWPEDARKEILSMSPGITSPASVIYRDEEKLLSGSGFMDDYLKKILPDKMRLDRLYIQEHSLFLDFDVLAVTLVSLIPAIRKVKVEEHWLFGGPIYQLFTRSLRWSFSDLIVTILAVGVSGIVWRLSSVINLGWQNFLLIAFLATLLVSVMNMLIGLDRVDWVDASPTYVLDLAFSSGISMVIFWLVTQNWIVRLRIPFSLIWLMFLSTFIGLMAVRYRERLITGLANRWLIMRGPNGSFAERILIIGTGNLAQLTIWLLKHSQYNLIFGAIGLVDDDPLKHGLNLMGLRVLGNTAGIPRLVEKFHIGLIFFAISQVSEQEKQRILQICQSTPAKTVLIPDLEKVLENSIQSMIAQNS